MHDADSRIRALILAYEDLEGEDRQKAEEFLAQNADVRRKLQRLRELEEWARDPVPLPEGHAPPDFGLSPSEEAQLARSLKALKGRLDLQPVRQPARRGPWSVLRGPGRKIWVPVAAAAVVALWMWSPWSSRELLRFEDLRVLTVEVGTGTSRGVETRRARRSGEAFALSFQLEKDAHVIVYHVDPAGRASLVFPGSPSDPMAFFEADLPQRIPAATADEQWVLGGETGRESFLLGASESADLDLEALDRQVHERLANVTDRGAVLDSLRTLLTETFETVQLIEFDHLP
jgi:hypothetical protein